MPLSRIEAPWCFAPRKYRPSYHVESLALQKYILRLEDNTSSDAKVLKMTIRYQKDTVNIRIKASGPELDPETVPQFLYEPYPSYPMPRVEWDLESENLLKVEIQDNPFQFSVRRTDTESILFSTAAERDTDLFDSIVYKGQYIEIGTRLDKNHYIYGLGERAGPFRKRSRRMAFNSRDSSAFENQNSYGSHPFYLELKPNGSAHGVVL